MAINFEQLAQSMGFTGAAADQLARSLQAASNSADRSANALNAEASAVARATQQTRTFGDQLANTLDGLVDFTGKIISTADGMATSSTVFTQISPMIQQVNTLVGQIGDMGTGLGTALGTLLGGPGGGAIGALIGKFLGGAIKYGSEIITSIFNQYLQQGEKVMGAFNALSSVGVTFGGSLQEMQKIIKNTGMPLEMLAKVAQSNAENLALLGGGVSGALETVAKAARNDLGPQLVTLYGGFASLSDELVDYMAMERRRGVNQDLLSDNNIESTKAYLYQLKEISALTGKSSKQLKQEIEQRSRNAATQGMLSKMSDTQRKQYDAAMLKVPDAVKGPLQDAFLAFSRGMEPVSTEFLQLQAAAPEAAESIRRMALAANKGPDEFNRVMDQESKNLTVSAGKLTEQMGDLFYLQQAGRLSSSLVDTLNKVITDINSNATRLKTMGEDSEKFAQQTAALAANATVFTTSVASIYDAQADLAVKLNQLVLGTEETEDKFKLFADVTNFATNTMSTFVQGLDNVVNFLLGLNRPREQRVSEQNERMTQVQREIEGIRRQRYTALRPYYESTEDINENTPAPEGTDHRQIQRSIRNFDDQIQLRLKRLKDLEAGIKNINEQEDEREAKEKENQRQQKLREQRQQEVSPETSSPVRTSMDNSAGTLDKQTVANLERAIQEQNIVLSKLAESVTSQGEQIYRAVNRMA